jgi:hypothetical protein
VPELTGRDLDIAVARATGWRVEPGVAWPPGVDPRNSAGWPIPRYSARIEYAMDAYQAFRVRRPCWLDLQHSRDGWLALLIGEGWRSDGCSAEVAEAICRAIVEAGKNGGR